MGEKLRGAWGLFTRNAEICEGFSRWKGLVWKFDPPKNLKNPPVFLTPQKRRAKEDFGEDEEDDMDVWVGQLIFLALDMAKIAHEGIHQCLVVIP